MGPDQHLTLRTQSWVVDWDYPKLVLGDDTVVLLSTDAIDYLDADTWKPKRVVAFMIPLQFYKEGVEMTRGQYEDGLFDEDGPYPGDSIVNHIDGNSYEMANGPGGWFYLKTKKGSVVRVPQQGTLTCHVHELT